MTCGGKARHIGCSAHAARRATGLRPALSYCPVLPSSGAYALGVIRPHTSVRLSLAGLATSLTRQSAMGWAFSRMSAATLCRSSARLHKGVLAQAFCAALAALNASSTSACVHAAGGGHSHSELTRRTGRVGLLSDSAPMMAPALASIPYLASSMLSAALLDSGSRLWRRSATRATAQPRRT